MAIITKTFSYEGGVRIAEVPAGTTTLTIHIWAGAGGGGGAELNNENGPGGGGAVRIIWGIGRQFPSTNTGDV